MFIMHFVVMVLKTPANQKSNKSKKDLIEELPFFKPGGLLNDLM